MADSLITVQELEDIATARGVDLTVYSGMLETIIARYEEELEDMTGRVFVATEVTDEGFDVESKSYLLYQYPVIEVTSVEIDDETLDETAYRLDKANGVIHLTSAHDSSNPTYPYPYDITVDYVAGYETPPNQIKMLLIDLILESIKMANVPGSASIQSVTEKNLSITYNLDKKSFANIDQRIRALKRPRTVIG